MNVAYHLTVAKVKAPELPIDYEPLGPVKPVKAAFKGKGKAPMKRKHGDIDEDKDKTTKRRWTAATWKTTAAPARYRTGKSVSYERWPFEPPSKVSRPLPCGSTGSCANRTGRTDLHLKVCADGWW